MTRRLAQGFVHGRFAVMALWGVAVAASVLLLPRLEIRFSLHPLLKGDREQVRAVREFYRTFPPAEGHAIVALSWDRRITVNDLRRADASAERLEALEEVRDVLSPASLLELEFQGFSLDEWARLGGDGTEPVELGEAPGMSLFRGRFLSRDLQSLAFHVRKARGVATSDFLEAVEREVGGWEQPARLLGTELVLRDMDRILRDNLWQLLALQFVALVIVLPVCFRSFRTAYLPMLSALTALLIYFAVLAAAGQVLGLIYLAGPLLLMVIGLSDGIHLQQRFDDARAAGADVAEALRQTLRSVGSACVLTSLTTAIGFLSLGLSGHPEVRTFGIWCAAGVVIAFGVVLVVLPAGLALFPGRGTQSHLRAHLVPRRRQRWGIPALILLVSGAAGIAFLRIDSSLVQELPSTTPSVRNLDWFARNFQGTDRIEVEVTGPLEDPEVFAAVERMKQMLLEQPGVEGASSWTDAVRFILPQEIVDTPDGPYLGMRALGTLTAFPRNLITREGDRANVIFYVSGEFGSQEFRSFRQRLRELARGLPASARAEVTGYTAMAYDSVGLISETLIKSFGLSLVAITVVLALALRSARLGLICLLPNALPILVAAGCAGWLDIPLRLGMVIVFSVGLGLAVDDTIHLVVRFRQLRGREPAVAVARHLDEALGSAGFGIVLTSLVLLLSAATFLRSDFSTLRETGLILGVITLAALLSDLVFFPWLIERFSRWGISWEPRSRER